MAGRIDGNVPVVTGGGGIGCAIAGRFAARIARGALVAGGVSTVDGGAMA